MKEKMNTTSSNDKKAKESWRKSVKRNGITESIEVQEVENGFIIRKEKYGEDLNSKSPNKWINETKEYVSKVNPLAEEEIDEDFDNLLKQFE